MKIALREQALIEWIEQSTDRPITIRGSIESNAKEDLDVTIPLQRGQMLVLDAGQIVKIKVLSRDGVISFISRTITDLPPTGGLVVVAKPSEVQRSQQREHFRIDVNIPVSYFVSTEPKQNLEMQIGPGQLGTIINISTGGLRFCTDAPIDSGAELRLELNLGDETAAAIGTALRSRDVQSKWGSAEVAVKFIRVRQKDEARIARFIQKMEFRGRHLW